MSKLRFERALAANKGAHRLNLAVNGLVLPGGLCRYSRLAGRLEPVARAQFERDRARASHCDQHGELLDPAVFLTGVGESALVVFVCPQCSSPEILAVWEQEGAS